MPNVTLSEQCHPVVAHYMLCITTSILTSNNASLANVNIHTPVAKAFPYTILPLDLEQKMCIEMKQQTPCFMQTL